MRPVIYGTLAAPENRSLISWFSQITASAVSNW
ncbi:hypothetical protein SAMN05216355_10839 [Actinomyces ruminicola]|uniref:Uncharacterized protein n=1 Tax=Actinomyces ruminicola TaxID=332524 RepID=A0A1H0CUV6_9ACTO|nr:hypothetical protein SAMN05216355_10839 [Actinomyces ruminicola]